MRRASRLCPPRRPALGRAPRRRGRSPHMTCCCASPASPRRLRPRLVIRVGDLPTSKPLGRGWPAWTTCAQLALDPEGAWQDPRGGRLADRGRRPRRRPRRLDDPGARSRLACRLDGAPMRRRRARSPESSATRCPSRAVARQLGERLPAHATLVRRLLDAHPRRRALLPGPAPTSPVCSPTGAQTASTARSPRAFGVAAASDGPVVLLIGDVALAHDVGGLLAARQLGLDLTIVVAQQRRRRDLPLPAGERRARRLRGARGHPARA